MTKPGYHERGTVEALESMLLEGRDKPIWLLDTKGMFQTQSLHKYLMDSGIWDRQVLDPWKAPIPLKIQIFLWLCFHGENQSVERLLQCVWLGDPRCKLCGTPETMNNLLFGCPTQHQCMSPPSFVDVRLT